MHRKPEKSEALVIGPTRASSDVTPAIKQGFNMSDSTQVSASRAITVPFHGADLYVVEHNGQPYTPMKPIVEGMGIDWKNQHAKLAANQRRWGMVEITIPTAGGLQSMACIALRKLFGWLAGIHVGKIKEEAQPKVLAYQNECDDVLWQYWNDGVAINPRAVYAVNPGDKLTAEEAESLRLMLKTAADRLPKAKQAALMVQGWSKLKAHFKVGYREIPRHEFSEAVSIIARHAAEWELVDDEPTPEGKFFVDSNRIDRALALAGEVASVAHRHVMQAVLADEEPWEHDRWVFMCNLRDPRMNMGNGFVANGWAKRLPWDVVVESPAELAESIHKGRWTVKSEDLSAIISACASRLEMRSRQSRAMTA